MVWTESKVPRIFKRKMTKNINTSIYLNNKSWKTRNLAANMFNWKRSSKTFKINFNKRMLNLLIYWKTKFNLAHLLLHLKNLLISLVLLKLLFLNHPKVIVNSIDLQRLSTIQELISTVFLEVKTLGCHPKMSNKIDKEVETNPKMKRSYPFMRNLLKLEVRINSKKLNVLIMMILIMIIKSVVIHHLQNEIFNIFLMYLPQKYQ